MVTAFLICVVFLLLTSEVYGFFLRIACRVHDWSRPVR